MNTSVSQMEALSILTTFNLDDFATPIRGNSSSGIKAPISLHTVDGMLNQPLSVHNVRLAVCCAATTGGVNKWDLRRLQQQLGPGPWPRVSLFFANPLVGSPGHIKTWYTHFETATAVLPRRLLPKAGLNAALCLLKHEDTCIRCHFKV